MGLLQAIGQAQPAKAIQNFQMNQSNLETAEQGRAVQDLQMQNLKQEMDIRRRQEEKAVAEEQANLAPRAIEPILNKFAGGIEGPIAQMVYKDISDAGYVKEAHGGMGTINNKTGTAINEMLKDPIYQAKLSRTRVGYWQQQYNDAQKAANDKPDDEKKQAELQTAEDGLNQAYGMAEAMTAGMEAREVEEPKPYSAQTDIGELFQDLQNRVITQDQFDTMVKQHLQGDVPKQKDAQTWLLDNGTRVNSFDGGRTYRSEDGSMVQMPTNAMEIDTTLTGSDLQVIKGQQEAQEKLKNAEGDTEDGAKSKEIKDMAEIGTGTWSNIRAAVDAVVGGVVPGVGDKPMFEDTQEARQALALIKQTGKKALMNSTRYPVTEQKVVDKMFPDPGRFIANPATEAKKIDALREIFKDTLRFNYKALSTESDPKIISKLKESNFLIEKVLDRIGVESVEQETGLSKKDQALIDKYSK